MTNFVKIYLHAFLIDHSHIVKNMSMIYKSIC